MPIINTFPSLTSDASKVPYTNSSMQNVSNVKQALDKVNSEAKQQILFSFYSEFPNIGDPEMLYVDETTTIVYMFNNDTLTYSPIIADIENYTIQAIL